MHVWGRILSQIIYIYVYTVFIIIINNDVCEMHNACMHVWMFSSWLAMPYARVLQVCLHARHL